MTSNSEKQRMATLLKSPELFNQVASFTDESSWRLTANQWIWKKYKEHIALHKTPPSINILLDYADSDKSDMESIAVAAAIACLKEYENQQPLDHDYFKSAMLTEGRDKQIVDSLFPAIKNHDWKEARDIIDAAFKQTVSLPPRLDLQSLVTKPSSDNQNLLNEWAFERQAILAIVAPTGIGKSVLTMQLSTHFACGKSVIGFDPHRAYKVLVIQNEDSDNDIALMRDGSLSLLTDKEKQMVYENLVFIRLRGSGGKTFLSALETYCEQYKPDMVFVNPLLKYFGGDPINSKEVSNFLNDLEPILERHNCGLVLIHHTIKQSKQSRINQVDSSYSGFGSSAWSNSVRDTVEIKQTKLDGYYKLVTGKRSSKWGWRERFLKRSSNFKLPFWQDVNAMDMKQLSEIDNKDTTSKTDETKDIIYDLIRPLPFTITIRDLEIQTGFSANSVRKYVKELLDTNQIAVVENKGNEVKKYYRTEVLKGTI